MCPALPAPKPQSSLLPRGGKGSACKWTCETCSGMTRCMGGSGLLDAPAPTCPAGDGGCLLTRDGRPAAGKVSRSVLISFTV